MQECLARTSRKHQDRLKLVGTLATEKLLLYALLLRWYEVHGAVIEKFSRTIDYQATKIFIEQVTEAVR